MTDSDALELDGRRLADQVRGRVEADLKRRFLVASLLGAGTLVTIALLAGRESAAGARIELAKAEALQKRAAELMMRGADESEQIKRRFENDIKRLEDTQIRVREQLELVENRASEVDQRISDAAKTTLDLSESFTIDVQRLKGVVGSLAQAEAPPSPQAQEIHDELARIDSSLARSREVIADASSRAGRSAFRVRVYGPSGAAVGDALASRGYRVSRFPRRNTDSYLPENCIVLSVRLPVEYAVEIIELARSQYDIQYVFKTEEPDQRTWIGMNFAGPLQPTDIDALLRSRQTNEQFYSKIRLDKQLPALLQLP